MLTLRLRILLTLCPLMALPAILGGSAIFLIHRLGVRIDAILRENYDSVLYMERLKEALERIDSSFTFALADKEAKAHKQYDEQWPSFEKNLHDEQNNITVAGEKEQVERLTVLVKQYRQQGDAFFAHVPKGSKDPWRTNAYFETGGLQDTFKEIKTTADRILNLNQEQMRQASQSAQGMVHDTLIGFVIGLVLAAVCCVYLAWLTVRDILAPIRAVMQSAQAIRAGNLDQVVPVMSRDELGQLANEFNAMARQLRHYRQSNYSRLLRAQRTSQATIDSFPDPVLVVDPDGQVEMANPAAQRLLGVAGKKADEPASAAWLPPEPLREPLKEALQNQRPYLPEEFDRVVLLRLEGQDHSFLPHILPIRDPWGFTLGAAVLLHDVTRFRLLDQTKSDLVATASHELKTPLTSIRLAHHLLLEEAVGPLTPKQTELLLDARENTERLLAMVNNLLDLGRLEQGREYLNLQPEATEALLQGVADNIRPRAEDKGLSVAVEVPANFPPITVDAERLGHALMNLLNNAVTYTDRGGRITLSAIRDESYVTLTVADTGVGIPPQYLSHIFDRFFRIPGQTRGSGTGLGLAIAREIIGAHGGTIACESEPGAGTIFRIKLPAKV